jgi:carbonic anhydrase/acetyltransferase-like protein (isoleucine patch superfamily)
MRARQFLRLSPLAGWISNRLRYPGLHCGLRVEIDGPGNFAFGPGVRIGEGTRIELPPASRLAIGHGVTVSRGVHLVPAAGARLEIGAATTIQDNCRIYGDVGIGQRCIFAPNAFVSSGTHVFDAFPHRPIQEQETLAPAAQRPIRIHADCWFGINVVITPGVTVGRGCVVGANSVVTGDLPPYQVAAGNPARPLRKRLEFVPKLRIDAANEHDAPYFYDGFDLTRSAAGAWTATGGFSLALAHPNPRALRLGLSGNGAVRLAGETQDVGPESRIVEFDLAGRAGTLPFLHLHADGQCQVQWAELV